MRRNEDTGYDGYFKKFGVREKGERKAHPFAFGEECPKRVGLIVKRDSVVEVVL